MSILLGLGGLPSGGRQFGGPVDGPAAGLGLFLGQVFPQMDVQATAGFNDRRDGRHFRPGFRTPKVQPVLAAKPQWAQATFAPVVVDLHHPVLQIDLQPAPLAPATNPAGPAWPRPQIPAVRANDVLDQRASVALEQPCF